KKSFAGRYIALVGANAPSGLASRPIRILLADEVDRFPVSAGTEGDPLSLAEKRTNNFYNAKKIFVSTPTIKGASRIESEFELSTME
ncbi:phage terminase large subunit family protein, partial [Micrococcus sp. SIMBA_144]